MNDQGDNQKALIYLVNFALNQHGIFEGNDLKEAELALKDGPLEEGNN